MTYRQVRLTSHVPRKMYIVTLCAIPQVSGNKVKNSSTFDVSVNNFGIIDIDIYNKNNKHSFHIYIILIRFSDRVDAVRLHPTSHVINA